MRPRRWAEGEGKMVIVNGQVPKMEKEQKPEAIVTTPAYHPGRVYVAWMFMREFLVAFGITTLVGLGLLKGLNLLDAIIEVPKNVTKPSNDADKPTKP